MEREAGGLAEPTCARYCPLGIPTFWVRVTNRLSSVKTGKYLAFPIELGLLNLNLVIVFVARNVVKCQKCVRRGYPEKSGQVYWKDVCEAKEQGGE